MWWRLGAAEFARSRGAVNRRAFHRIVSEGPAPGILAYDGQTPVGWCAVAPREQYPRLEKSRVLRRVDDRPVWSVTCLFIARTHRRRGVSAALLEAAARHVARHGGEIVEGYPFDPRSDSVPAAFVWTGLTPAFRKAGFREVARRSKSRPIMWRNAHPRRRELGRRYVAEGAPRSPAGGTVRRSGRRSPRKPHPAR